MVSSWVSIGPPSYPNVTAVGVLAGSVVFAATNDSGVLRTDDGGMTWTPLNAGLTNMSVRTLAVLTEISTGLCGPPKCSTPYPVLYAGTYGGGVFKGDGTSWHPLNNGLTSLKVLALAVSPSPSYLYAATEDRGIFHSADGGATWASHNR